MNNLTQSITDEIEARANKADDTDISVAQACLAKNPFTKEHWNITRQCEITARMPDFAKVLEARAKAGTDFDEAERNAWIKAFPEMKVKKAKSYREDGAMVRGFEYSVTGGGHA